MITQELKIISEHYQVNPEHVMDTKKYLTKIDKVRAAYAYYNHRQGVPYRDICKKIGMKSTAAISTYITTINRDNELRKEILSIIGAKQ